MQEPITSYVALMDEFERGIWEKKEREVLALISTSSWLRKEGFSKQESPSSFWILPFPVYTAPPPPTQDHLVSLEN